MSNAARRPLIAAFAALALVAFAMVGGAALTPAKAVEPAAARAFIEELAGETNTVLNAGSSLEQRRSELRALLYRGFDVPFLARTVLGPAYRDLNDDQRDAYVQAFEHWVLATYVDRLDDYTGRRIEVVGAEPQGQQDARVTTRVVGNHPPVRIDWRVRERGGGLQIIDIEVEGVSMAISQRSEFASVVQRQGIDGLISMLQSRAGPLT